MKKTGIILVILVICIGIFLLSSMRPVNNNENAEDDYLALSGLQVSELRTEYDDNNLDTDGLISSIHITEKLFSMSELINISDLIVKGKVVKKLGEYDYYISENDQEYTVLRSLYSFDLEEVLKGENIEKIYLSFPKDYTSNIELNKEYLLCLTQLDGDFEKTYTAISINQGIFEVDQNTLTNMRNMSFNETDFKNRISNK